MVKLNEIRAVEFDGHKVLVYSPEDASAIRERLLKIMAGGLNSDLRENYMRILSELYLTKDVVDGTIEGIVEDLGL